MQDQQVPDVTSLRLDTASKILNERGIPFFTRETAPVRTEAGKRPGSAPLFPVIRVVRQRSVPGEIVELVIAREDAGVF